VELSAAEQVMELALAINKAVSYSNIRSENKIAVSVKIGMHTGPVTFGVTGLSGLSKKYNYDIWGHTVTIANNLANFAPSNSIVVTDEAYFYIGSRNYVLEPIFLESQQIRTFKVLIPEENHLEPEVPPV
jgi:class 3 adenylate cyclase